MKELNVVSIREKEYEDIPVYNCFIKQTLEDYFNKQAWEDAKIENQVSNTHYLIEDEKIVGYFTLSLNTFKIKKNKQKKLNLKGIEKRHGINQSKEKHEGVYIVVYLNFFGIDDNFKGKKIDSENLDTKYSDLLFFLLFTKLQSIFEILPFSMIVLQAFEEVSWFYEKYDFEYITESHDGMKIYAFPSNRIDNYLDMENENSPFYNLLNYLENKEIS